MEIKTLFFWILLVAMALPSIYFGYTKLVSQRDKVELFHRLGYPVWFMQVVGLAEVVGAIMLLLSPTRMGGIGILAIILAGAIFSHWRAKDPTKELMTPVFVSIHLAIIFVFTQF